MKRSIVVLLLGLILIVSISCVGGTLGKETVEISMYYGSEKEEWLVPLVEEYNRARNETSNGKIIKVEAVPLGSVETSRQILDGTLQPTVWSPASSLVLPITNAEWRKVHNEDLITETHDLVLSPVVIAMWESMAQALGYPEKQIGWADIAALSIAEEGWEAYGYPEWGDFKFGHTHPEFSNSGLISIVAQAYTGAEKQRGLTVADINDADTIQLMTDVQKSIIHYGSSTGFFANRLFEGGPSYLSAAVVYENLVINQENKRLAGESFQMPVVAIYPKEGTFWSNHPYAILNASWVTEEQNEAAVLFREFLLATEQQQRALEVGFRPADVNISLRSPIDANHGVDPMQPKTVLEQPSADVILAIQDLWHVVKKPVDLLLVVDVSGSMQGDKIAAARTSLAQFVDRLGDNDRLSILLFSSEVVEMSPLSPLGPKRQDVSTRVGGIIEGGNTNLYDAILHGYDLLEQQGDESHIRAIVVLSDGVDTSSINSLSMVEDRIRDDSEAGGNSIKLFTIGYGDDADEGILKRLAEGTGGQFYQSLPQTISEIYTKIATFF
jgi:Ca-activated chloride channel homolog